MRALQKTIFVGCRELGLDNDARKALQMQVCGKSSMSDMNDDELQLVVDRLVADGFKHTSKGPKR